MALDATQFVVKLVQGHAAKIDGANFGQFPANKVGHAFCTTGDRPQVQFLIPVVRRPMATPPKTRRRRRTPAVTRSHGKLVVIASATFVSLYLCYRLAVPFLPALVWSVTAAVVTQSLVRWLGRWVKSPARRAAAAVSVVAIALFVPVIGLVTFAAVEISQAVQNLQPAEFFAKWQEAIQGQPRAATAWETISSNLDITRVADQLLAQVNSVATTVVSGSVYSLVMALLTLFMLFFLYRDKDRAMAAVRQLSPFTNAETDRLLTRLDDTIHATIFGIVVVAMIQGTLGGLIFYLLGLPAPVLWGTVMAFLSVIPYLGSFVVWIPTAIFLALSGDWFRATVLIAWGMIVIGLIDNLLYPMLVGNRLRQHTVIAFIAIVGGIAVFGASGVVLGPVVISLTFFLLEVWRRRTANGRAVDIG